MEHIPQRAMALRRSGLCCSQIVAAIAGLEPFGVDNPQLIQALGGLGYGVHAQHACGALTGGACTLAMHLEPEALPPVVGALNEWFVERFGAADCRDLLAPAGRPSGVCLQAVEETAAKCLELLAESGLL